MAHPGAISLLSVDTDGKTTCALNGEQQADPAEKLEGENSFHAKVNF